MTLEQWITRIKGFAQNNQQQSEAFTAFAERGQEFDRAAAIAALQQIASDTTQSPRARTNALEVLCLEFVEDDAVQVFVAGELYSPYATDRLKVFVCGCLLACTSIKVNKIAAELFLMFVRSGGGQSIALGAIAMENQMRALKQEGLLRDGIANMVRSGVLGVRHEQSSN